nr:MAG TPA: hypothetical protein [Bacteriophage sp.]
MNTHRKAPICARLDNLHYIIFPVEKQYTGHFYAHF